MNSVTVSDSNLIKMDVNSDTDIDTKDVLFSCGLCGHKTSGFADLSTHFKEEHPAPNHHNCSLCLSRFSTMSDLLSHTFKVHMGMKEFNADSKNCPSCPQKWKNQEQLQNHLVNEHVDNLNPFKCVECTFACDSQAKLKEHLDSQHSQNQSLKCEFCTHTEDNRQSLMNHIIKVHLADSAVISNANQFHLEPVFDCKLCDKFNGVTLKTIQFHVRNAHGILQCFICSAKISDRTAMAAHMAEKHQEVLSLACPICKFKASDLANVTMHLLQEHLKLTQDELLNFNGSHESDGTMTCPVVMCRFNTKEMEKFNFHIVSKHLRTDGFFKCEHCRFKTKKLPFFVAHIISNHLGGMATKAKTMINDNNQLFFNCMLCTLRGVSVTELRSHLSQVHFIQKLDQEPGQEKVQDAQPLQCSECDYQARDRLNLEIHRQVSHVGLAFKCQLCQFRAKTNDEVVEHETIVHLKDKVELSTTCPDSGARLYNCRLCQVQNQAIGSMIIHQSSVHGDANKTADDVNRYKCHDCAFFANSQPLLHDHILMTHLVGKALIVPGTKIRDRPAVKCLLCTTDQIFSMTSIRMHIQIHHSNSRGKNLLTSNRQFKCKECPFSTDEEHKLKSHTVKCHIVIIICTLCQKEFTNREDIVQHCLDNHLYNAAVLSNLARDERIVFDCKYCSRQALTLHQMADHIKSSHLMATTTEAQDTTSNSDDIDMDDLDVDDYLEVMDHWEVRGRRLPDHWQIITVE